MPELPMDPEIFEADELCFGCGPKHPTGLHLRFSKTEDEVLTRFTPGKNFQGPPGIMHGGLVMTAADELAAWTLIGLRERFGFTISVEARLVGPVRIGKETLGRGRIKKETSRVARIEAELSQDGQTVFTCEMAFALLDRAGAEKLLGMTLPDAWKRFCR